MERVKGIEPSSQAWEARILPLNHTRLRSDSVGATAGRPAFLQTCVSVLYRGMLAALNLIVSTRPVGGWQQVCTARSESVSVFGGASVLASRTRHAEALQGRLVSSLAPPN